MKICLTVNSSPWSKFKGGGQLAVHQLASALIDQDQEVHVIYSKSKRERFDQEVPYKIHWAHHYNFATLNLNIFSYRSVLRSLAHKERFDIIHGNAEEAYYANTIARETGADYVFTSHAPNIPSTGILSGFKNPIRCLKSINTYLLRKAAGSAKKIVTFSQFSRGIVMNSLGSNFRDRVEVISPGIETSWLETMRNTVSSPHILFWGRIEDEKGLPELFIAMKKISSKIPKAQLTVIGEGNQLERYKQNVLDQGLSENITFPGWMDTPAIQQLASKCSLGVFPSRIESFGLSVIEAMAAGLPVIAASSGAIPENIKDGVTGTIVPSENPYVLANTIIEALKTPERSELLACNAKNAIRKKFSWSRTASQMIKLYQVVREQ